MPSVLSFSRSRRSFSRTISLSRRTTSLSSRRSSVRSDLMVSFCSGDRSTAVRRGRVSVGRGSATLSEAGAARALRSRAFSLRNASIVARLDAMPASEWSFSRRATAACKEGTSLAEPRASFVFSSATLNLSRQALNRDFHKPASIREPNSARRSSSERTSAALARARSRSARACACSYHDRQSHGACTATAARDEWSPPTSTGVKSVPKPSSGTTMRSTVAHGKTRYQPLCGGLDSMWMMSPMSTVHGLAEQLLLH